MRTAPRSLLLPLAFLLSVPAAFGSGDPPSIFSRVEEFRLDNGMLFLLLPRHEVPMVSGRVLFRVGNVDNPTGQSGLAHMFEHMAFKGTDRIGTRDFEAEMMVQDSVARVGAELAREMSARERADPERIEALRAQLAALTDRQMALTVPMEWPRVYDSYTLDFNAYTTEDFTVYEARLPANNLEVWMLMESERIQHPIFREFYRERDVVIQERLEQTEDNPNGMARELLQSLAFTAHPYRQPTIGYMCDIEVLTQEQAAAFRETYYVPGNAVAALVGDFDVDEAKRMIRAYFGDIPAGPPPPEVAVMEPPQKGMRRGIHRQGTDRRVLLAFPGFHPHDRRHLAAALLADVLSRDETSRLDRRLDFEEQAVRSVRASGTAGFHRYAGLFLIEAVPLEAVSNERVEALIWEELERVVTEPVTQEKLDEIRRSYRKRYYYSLETNDSIAEALVHHQAIRGDWRWSYERFDRYDEITVGDVTALAEELFQPDRATVVYLEPDAEVMIAEKGGAR